MKKRYLIGAAAVVLILVACHDENDPVVVQAQPAQQPQAVYQQPPVVVQNDSDHGFLSGLMMGHLMSSNYHSPSVVHHYTTRTVIKRSYSPRRSYYSSRRSGRR